MSNEWRDVINRAPNVYPYLHEKIRSIVPLSACVVLALCELCLPYPTLTTPTYTYLCVFTLHSRKLKQTPFLFQYCRCLFNLLPPSPVFQSASFFTSPTDISPSNFLLASALLSPLAARTSLGSTCLAIMGALLLSLSHSLSDSLSSFLPLFSCNREPITFAHSLPSFFLPFFTTEIRRPAIGRRCQTTTTTKTACKGHLAVIF